MATRLYGVLLDGLKKPIVNATVVLLAKGNTITVLNGSEAIFKTDAQGAYNVTVQSGYYKVIIGPQGIEPYKAGEIAIYADSPEGSLNSYLVNWAEEDLTPEVIKQVKELVAISEQYSLQAGRSAAAAQADATDARNSKASAAQSASEALVYKNDSKTNADAAKQAQAGAAGSANTANAAVTTIQGIQKDVTASKDRAVTAETNAKSSENVATQAKEQAVTAKEQAVAAKDKAQQIADSIDPQSIKNSIGLGLAPRDCPDISGNPSGYVGFMRIMSTATGFPSIASGESSLTGFISQVDGTPAYTGVFQGWATRSLYTYRWNPTIGPQWTRHARKDEVIRFQRSSDTRTIILSTDVQADGCYLQVDADGQWGAFNPKAGRWQPLAVAQGGTGANDASTARSKLEVMFEAKTGLDANTNLNDIKGTTAGFYYQPMSANAKPELNYPIQLAGALLVQRTGANGSDGCIQSYFVYNNSSILYRRIYTSTQGWSVWKKIVLTERIEEGKSITYVYSNYSPLAPRLQVSTSGLWGCHNGSSWVPLPIGQGGTNAATVDGARTNLGLGRNNSPQLNSLFLDRYSDSTGAYTTGGMLHTRLLANDNTVRLAADMYVQTFPNEQGRLTIRFTYGGSAGATKYLDFTSEGNLIVDSAILKSTVEKPLQINSANPAIRFNETDRPANTPTYTLIANAGDWFIQKRDYDDAGSVSNAIAYNFANDRIDVQNLKASGLITANSVTTSSPVKSGGGRVEILGSVADFSAMSCYVRGLNSTGSSAAWVLGMHSGESKMVSLKNYHSNAEILLNGSDGAVQLKTGAVGGAAAQAITINKDEVYSTVNFSITKGGKRLSIENSANSELSFNMRVWGSSTRQNVFEVGTSAAYLFYAQKTSQGQLFDVNGNINCVTLNQSSDRRLKENITVIADATGAIRKINGYTYTLKDGGSNKAGVIAQEVMEALPEAVGSFIRYGQELPGPTADGNRLREEEPYLNVDYSALTGLLVQFARESDDRITKLETEIEELKKLVATLVNKETLP